MIIKNTANNRTGFFMRRAVTTVVLCVLLLCSFAPAGSRAAFRKAAKTKATLMFTGDLMCLKGQQYDALTKDGFDFYPCYRYVAQIFKEADMVCGNLESLISESNPLTKDCVYENDQPQCNGPVAYLDALKRASFDVLVTANNHTCDWGAVGITETKKHLDEYGFLNVGTHYEGSTSPSGLTNTADVGKTGAADGPVAEDRFVIYEARCIKIAILSYTHLINQRYKMTREQLNTMVHLYDPDAVKQDIADAKTAGAQFVVVYLHNGTENTEELTKTQIDDSGFVAEAGADLIIGSHPHCLQKCTYIKTSDGREVLCMYSMGNFVSSMTRDINNDTLILKVTLTCTRYGEGSDVKMTDASYIPCRVAPKAGHSFTVIPILRYRDGSCSSKSLKEAADRVAAVMDGVIPERGRKY